MHPAVPCAAAATRRQFIGQGSKGRAKAGEPKEEGMNQAQQKEVLKVCGPSQPLLCVSSSTRQGPHALMSHPSRGPPSSAAPRFILCAESQWTLYTLDNSIDPPTVHAAQGMHASCMRGSRRRPVFDGTARC